MASGKLVAEQEVQHFAAGPMYAGRVELALRRAVPRAECVCRNRFATTSRSAARMWLQTSHDSSSLDSPAVAFPRA